VLRTRENWNSYYGFLFAAIGAAVGIGNIWRFPYIVGTNGGGAFLITYIIVIFTFGLSFMFLEFLVGRYYQTSIISSLMSIKNKFKFIGIFMVVITFSIVSYYLVILGWVLSYAIFSIIGITNEFSFDDFTDSYYPILSFVGIVAINFVIIKAGINKGIERVSKIGVLFLISIMIPLTILGISMPGSDKGIGFYLKPDFSVLNNPGIWSVAFGQAFFSLSIGMGVLLTYGSYLGKESKRPLLTSSIIVVVADLLIAFTAGLMIFSFVFASNMDPAQGISIVFRVMPDVFANLGDYGIVIVASLFFFLLLFAGITSSISMLQVPVSSLQDTLNMSKSNATIIISVLVLVSGMFSALSYSPMNLAIGEQQLPFLDMVDSWFGTHGLAVSAAIFVVAVTWFMDKKIIIREANLNSPIKLPYRLFIIIKFALPALILTTVISQIIIL